MDKRVENWISKNVKTNRSKSGKDNIDKLCSVGDFKVQEQQTLVSKFINSSTPFENLLIYHKIGSGKTCAAIQIAENSKFDKVIVIVPASLKTNFYDELLSKCSGNKYLSDVDRKLIDGNDISSDERNKMLQIAFDKIDEKYEIISYNKFFSMRETGELDVDNALIIIDEVHNLISNTSNAYQYLLDLVNERVEGTVKFKLVLMTATPIVNKANELALLFNVLNAQYPDKLLPTDREFNKAFTIKGEYLKDLGVYERNLINEERLKDCFRNLVSYYPGANPITFPKRINNIVRCVMSPFQMKQYVEYRYDNSENNNFLSKSRMASNIAYPNGKLGKSGYLSLKDSNALGINNIGKYSNKFLTILKSVLDKKNEGLHFIYCPFLFYGGLKPLCKLFKHHGFNKYNSRGSNSNNSKNFIVWSSEMSNGDKQELKRIINSKDNMDASLIKVVFGSPAIKEGVSFKRVRHIHLVNPNWTVSGQEQIIGRGYRFCSHYDLSSKKRDMNVNYYLSVSNNEDEVCDDESILNNSIRNDIVNKKFLRLLENCAVDCNMFNYGNCIRT